MTLEGIKKILDSEEFTCCLSPATEKIPLENLKVFLGIDAKGRERILDVSTSEQQVTPQFLLPDVPIPFCIQFRTQLPFKVKNSALNEVASLLLFLNQRIGLPGFELNELDCEVIYRYVWVIHPSVIDRALILSIVGMLMLNLSLFVEIVESLAECG